MDAFNLEGRGTWNEPQLPSNLVHVSTEPHVYERVEAYTDGYWLTADDIDHVISVFTARSSSGLKPVTVTHPKVLAATIGGRNKRTGFQVDICNNRRPNLPRLERTTGNGSHWVTALWTPCQPPTHDVWVFEPRSDSGLLDSIKADLPDARICRLGWQFDGWQCGYFCLWMRMVLIEKLGRGVETAELLPWPCQDERELCEWFHGLEPPSPFYCIVWCLLEWRDDLIVAPTRSTPNWVPNYDVVHEAFSSCVRKHIRVETGEADFDAVRKLILTPSVEIQLCSTSSGDRRGTKRMQVSPRLPRKRVFKSQE